MAKNYLDLNGLQTYHNLLEDYIDEHSGGEANVIELVKQNGTALPITNKSVDITTPTKTSDLTNDSGFITGYTETDPTVPSWAKQDTKPTYTASEVGLGNVGNFKAVSTQKGQNLTESEKAYARDNIGASNFSGSYNDLSNKPTIPTKVSELTNDSGYTTNIGTVTSVNVGTTPHSPSNGVVSIPPYPTSLPASDTTSKYSSTGTAPVNGIAVASALATLPEPMVFEGTLGTGGTITTLPSASASNKGQTYKVITDGTYASQTAKVGDTFVSDGSSWVLIPSGDDVEDTWRNIYVNGREVLGNGVSSGGVDFVDGKNTSVTYDSVDHEIFINATDTKYTANTTSIGSASEGTAIAADDITAWSAGTRPSLTTETIHPVEYVSGVTGTPTSATISEGVLTFTAGDNPVTNVTYATYQPGYQVVKTWSAGTSPSLSYTPKSIPNISVTPTTVVTDITES